MSTFPADWPTVARSSRRRIFRPPLHRSRALGSSVAALLGLLVPAAAPRPATAQADPPKVIVVAPNADVFLHPERPELQLEAAWNGGLAVPVKTVLKAPSSGKHWLTVVSRDSAGNVSEPRWIRIVVDAEPPEVEITTEPKAEPDAAGVYWLPVGATVRARAEDALSGVQGVLIETQPESSGAGEVEAVTTLDEEATYEIRAEAIDGVDNRSEPTTVTYHTDRTEPYGEFFIEGPHIENGGRLVLGPEAELHIKIDDDRSGVVHWMAKMDGEDIEKSRFHSGWPRGPHFAGAHTMDRVGNHVDLGPFEFTYDDEAPEIAWQVVNERGADCSGGAVYVPPVEVSLSATDADAGVESFEISSDGNSWQSAADTASLESEALHLRATDAVGNRGEATTRWTLDREPPELALVTADGTVFPAGGDGPQIEAVDGDVLKIQVEDDGCTVPDVRYLYEDGRVISRSGRSIPIHRRHCFIRPLQERTCKLIVEAVDQFGREARGVWHVRVAKRQGGAAE